MKSLLTREIEKAFTFAFSIVCKVLTQFESNMHCIEIFKKKKNIWNCFLSIMGIFIQAAFC